jgi:hypothetical protein
VLKKKGEGCAVPRTFAALVPPLLVTLSLLSPGRAVAGPPEAASGKTVLDEVADGLRKYRGEKDEAKRIALMVRLAATSDPRVALVLGEALDGAPPARNFANLEIPVILLAMHYVPKAAGADPLGGLSGNDVAKWWKANAADLRRRAAQLAR